MKIAKTRLFQIPVGNSKISVFQLSGSDDYALLIQSLESEELAIASKENGEYQILSENGEFTEVPVIVKSVSKKQLLEFRNILNKKFPEEE